MINRILAGTATADDIEAARAYQFDDRKKLMERLIGTLEGSFEDTLVLNGAIDDIANALAQARPVFAAGLSADQALGFIVKMIGTSMDDLAEAGEADSEEYEKQELVKETLEGFIGTCEDAGTTQGEAAFETVHLEYRGECAKLETQKKDAEAKLANSLTFMKETYGESNELDAFLKGIDHNMAAARFIGLFGSPSFFACKHVAAPGESYKAAETDAEAD